MTVKRWLGSAASTFDAWTISLSGTVVSQAYSVTINSKSIIYIAGSGDTVGSILAGLVAAWTSLVTPSPVEFTELTPVVSGTTIVATANTAGNPCTISVSTGGSAIFTISHTQFATGPNDFTNAQNWSGGAAPASSDTLVFDSGSVPCSFNINSSLTGITLQVLQGYSGAIGLPFINSNNSITYAEYRTTSLTFVGGTAFINAPTCKQCNLAFGANTTTARVLSTGSRINQYIPVVLITGGNGSSELDISKGDVALAFYAGTTATFPTIKSGFTASPLSDVTLYCGSGSTLTTVTQNGGNVTLQAAITTATVQTAGGTLTIQDAAATTINMLNGTLNLNTTSTIGTLNLYNSATLNCDSDPRAKTITNPINVYDSAVTIIDNAKSINSATLSLATSDLLTVNVQHGGNATMIFT